MGPELEPVIAWLEAGEAADYRAGVLLLQEHSRQRGLVNNLLKKESVANREKLHYELVKLICGGNTDSLTEVLQHFAAHAHDAAAQLGIAAAAVAPFVQAVTVAVDALATEPEFDQVDPAAQAHVDICTQLMTQAYTQRVQLSNSLATLDPADGPRVVGEILALENQYNALAEKRRRLATGEPAPAAEPAAEAAAPVDRAALVQQRGNLRSNLSKTRKKAEEAKSEEKKSEYAQKAGKLEVELNLVEMQLAAPQA